MPSRCSHCKERVFMNVTHYCKAVKMSEEIKMGTEVWGRNEVASEWCAWKGPYKYCGPLDSDRSLVYVGEIGGASYFDEVTTTDPHVKTLPDWDDALPPGCEVWKYQESPHASGICIHFGDDKRERSMEVLRSSYDFSGFLYQIRDGSYHLASFYPAWESINDNLRSVYNSSSEKATLIGAVMEVEK